MRQRRFGRVAGPFNLLHEYRTVVKFDVAFDTTNKVYLLVCGDTSGRPSQRAVHERERHPIGGVFTISATNMPLIPAGPELPTARSRASSSSLRQIVANNVHQKAARLVTYSGGAASLGSEIFMNQWSGGAAPSRHRVFAGRGAVPGHLVEMAGQPRFLRDVDQRGGSGGRHLQLTNPSDGQSDPEIACDQNSNRCLVVGQAWGAFAPGFASSTSGPVRQRHDRRAGRGRLFLYRVLAGQG